jgi:hypothetical protein
MKRARGTSDNGAKQFPFNTHKESSNKCIDKLIYLAGEVTERLCRFWTETEG